MLSCSELKWSICHGFRNTDKVVAFSTLLEMTLIKLFLRDTRCWFLILYLLYLVTSFILCKRIWVFITMEREVLLVNIRNGMTKEFCQLCFCLHFQNVYLTVFRCAYLSISFIRFHNYLKKLNFLFLINSDSLPKLYVSLSFKKYT